METLAQPIKKTRRTFPELVYERWGGVTYYRKGYSDVLKNLKTPAEIMGASGLQSFLVGYLNWTIMNQMNRKIFRTLTNEPGLHIGRNENLSCDVMLYERSVLTNDKITTKYVDIPPLVSIEVDVKVDLKNQTEHAYVFGKTQKLMDFGATKVIWVLTDVRQVLVFDTASPEATYRDWHSSIDVVPGVSFNIGQYLTDEGFAN
jgi:Uma2 family endonuclease